MTTWPQRARFSRPLLAALLLPLRQRRSRAAPPRRAAAARSRRARPRPAVGLDSRRRARRRPPSDLRRRSRSRRSRARPGAWRSRSRCAAAGALPPLLDHRSTASTPPKVAAATRLADAGRVQHASAATMTARWSSSSAPIAIDPANPLRATTSSPSCIFAHGTYDQAIAFADRAASSERAQRPPWASRAYACRATSSRPPAASPTRATPTGAPCRRTPNNRAALAGLARVGRRERRRRHEAPRHRELVRRHRRRGARRRARCARASSPRRTASTASTAASSPSSPRALTCAPSRRPSSARWTRPASPLDDIDAVAATYGPGLVGSLLVGLCAAKAIAFARDLPFLGVNHLEGHLLSVQLDQPVAFPVRRAAGLRRPHQPLPGARPRRLRAARRDARRRRRRGVRQGRQDARPRLPRRPRDRRAGARGDPRAIRFPRARLKTGRARRALRLQLQRHQDGRRAARARAPRRQRRHRRRRRQLSGSGGRHAARHHLRRGALLRRGAPGDRRRRLRQLAPAPARRRDGAEAGVEVVIPVAALLHRQRGDDRPRRDASAASAASATP